MKNKTLFIIFILWTATVFAQDTVQMIHNGKVLGSVIIPKPITPVVDTAAIILLKCAVKPPTPPAQSVGKTLYIGGEFAQIILSSVLSQDLKWYLQDYGYTGVSYYGLGNISSTDWNKLRAFNKDLRINYGITYIEATGSSVSSINSRIAFNKTCTDAREKFNAYNNEKEYWNAKDATGKITDAAVLAEWKKDSVTMTQISALAIANGLTNVWYHGWSANKGTPPYHMERMLSKFQYHVYQKTPTTSYGDWRWVDANKSVTGNRKPCSVIISAESAFSGDWLVTHTIDDVVKIFEPYINSYSNLYLSDIQVFMYSKIAQYQKPKRTSALAVAKAMVSKAKSTPADTVTAVSHIETAVER